MSRATIFHYNGRSKVRAWIFNTDLAAVRIRRNTGTRREEMVVASCCQPYDFIMLPPGDALKELRSLIAGTQASHHIVWTSTDTIRRGESLYDYIIGTKMQIVNSSNEPTIVIKN